MNNVLIDSCFWFSYLGTRNDNNQVIAKVIYERLEKNSCNLIIPYPSLYETINTKLLRDKNRKAADWFLKQLVSNPRYYKIYDDSYRESAFAKTLEGRNRGISLVDQILREMMKDKLLRIDTLITFNTGDFIDVCSKYGVDLINEKTQFNE